MYNDSKREDMKNYQCKNCGGKFLFDPETQKMVCERCGTVEDFQDVEEAGEIPQQSVEITSHDFNIEEHKNFEGWTDENRVYRCSSCGAVTTLEKNVISTSCSFCGSSLVQKIDISPGIKPESLLAFQVNQAKAEELFKKWIGGKFFAKSGSKNGHSLENFRGVYLPFWLYDANANAYYRARLGYDSTDSDGSTTTNWKTKKGTYEGYYENAQVTASETLSQEEVEKIYPYNMKELRPYNSNFLSGFSAERYSIDAAQGFKNAENIFRGWISSDIEYEMKRKHHPDKIDVTIQQMTLSNVKYKHILAPLWISAFTYNGKTYRFLINGQTGRVEGQYPISWVKIILVVLLVLIALVILYYILNNI